MIKDNVISFIKKHDMLRKNSNVLVCVSGGSDSMCLLHIMNELSAELDFTVSCAHYNHKLRGEESDADELFVRDECRKLNIECYVGSGDVMCEAKRSSAGLEETARKMRYDFFYETALNIGADRIATAHNADDNLETVILRLTRGTGLLGLLGIPPVRGNIIRPLLSVTRKEIDEYLLTNGISHREDSSNRSDDYSRNKIRHHVMPVLREINPTASKCVTATTDILREDERFLKSLSDDFIKESCHEGAVSCKSLSGLPFPVSSRVIRTLCGDGLSYKHVLEILELCSSPDPSASIDVPNMTVRREYDKIVFSREEDITFSPIEITAGKTHIINELNLSVKAEYTVYNGGIYKSLNTFLLKKDNICGDITVRPRITGDSIKLSEGSGTKSLKKLFIEKKIPSLKRASIPVAADQNGPVAVFGVGCDVRFKPLPGDYVLKLTFEEITNL